MSDQTRKTMLHDAYDPEAEAAAARREERQGWLILIGIFALGGVLVLVAAIAT
jgi:hypothetical protein